MKLTAKAGVLATALAVATAGSRANKTTPAVVHLATAEGAISITCSDRDTTIWAEATAIVVEAGVAAVSADRLTALTSGFDAGTIVTVSTTESAVKIESGNSRSRLPLIPLSNLLAALAIDSEIAKIEIEGTACLSLLEPLSVAAAEQPRFYLNGVFWHSVDDRLVAVSTDGARLISTSVAAGTFSTTRDLILPARAAMVLHKLLLKTKPSKLELRRSRTLISFAGPTFSLTSRLIDASFPTYETLLPKTSPNLVICKRPELLAAVSRLAAVATIEPPLLALSWTQVGTLDLRLARQPLDGADTISAEVRGNVRVAVPLSQLAGILGEFHCDHVRLESAEGQPLVIRGAREKLALITRSYWNFYTEKREEVAHVDSEPSSAHDSSGAKAGGG